MHKKRCISCDTEIFASGIFQKSYISFSGREKRTREDAMSTVPVIYNRYSFLTEDQHAAGRIASTYDRLRSQENTETEKPANTDEIAFSDKGRQLAGSSSLSREYMEGLHYEPLLTFGTEDGSTVSVDLASEGEGDDARYSAVCITITKPDGSEESLYISFDMTGIGEESQDDAAEAAAQAETAGETGETAKAEETGEIVPSLLELVEQYGLNKVPDASEALFAAIKARIEAMIEAAAETAEETEELEQIKAAREERGEAAAAPAAEGEQGTEETGNNYRSGGSANVIVGYTSRGRASASHVNLANFSRRY